METETDGDGDAVMKRIVSHILVHCRADSWERPPSGPESARRRPSLPAMSVCADMRGVAICALHRRGLGDCRSAAKSGVGVGWRFPSAPASFGIAADHRQLSALTFCYQLLPVVLCCWACRCALMDVGSVKHGRAQAWHRKICGGSAGFSVLYRQSIEGSLSI